MQPGGVPRMQDQVVTGAPDRTTLSTSQVSARANDADVDAAAYPDDEWLLAKAGEPRGDRGALLHYYNFRPRASDVPRDACDGSGNRGSRLAIEESVQLLGD